MKQFLLKAKVVQSKHTGKGITSPWRLTLIDGTVTHDRGDYYRPHQSTFSDIWGKR